MWRFAAGDIPSNGAHIHSQAEIPSVDESSMKQTQALCVSNVGREWMSRKISVGRRLCIFVRRLKP
jgi:hypothetical protein